MNATKRRDNRRWVVEFLQIYHMPVMNIRQGWHALDICANETAAQNKLSEYSHWNCELRIRSLQGEEDIDYIPTDFD
jgi:hypothetical protein